MTVTGTIDALEDASLREAHPLRDPAFVDALLRLIPCQGITLVDLSPALQDDTNLESFPWPFAGGLGEGFWDYFWDCLPCSYTERVPKLARTPATTTDFYSHRTWRSHPMYAEVMRPGSIEWALVIPLPSPSGSSRRLVLFRDAGPAFGGDETATAKVLRPHLAEALRSHDRRRAAAPLTPRQRELLWLCASGLDNTRIARRLGLSTGTVRKHLENTFDRLGVTSRAEAVAVVLPDLLWVDGAGCGPPSTRQSTTCSSSTTGR